MEHNYYDIFNRLDKLEQQSKDHENKLNDMKQFYEDKLNNMKQEYENKIKELNMIVKIDNPIKKINTDEVSVSKGDRSKYEYTHILEPNMHPDHDIKDVLIYLRQELTYYKKNSEDLDIMYDTEPLILTIKNNVAHLYGAVFGCVNYIIPLHINTNSKKPRLLYNVKIHNKLSSQLFNHNIILHNNIITLYASDYIYNRKSILFPNIGTFLTIDIHFNL